MSPNWIKFNKLIQHLLFWSVGTINEETKKKCVIKYYVTFIYSLFHRTVTWAIFIMRAYTPVSLLQINIPWLLGITSRILQMLKKLGVYLERPLHKLKQRIAYHSQHKIWICDGKETPQWHFIHFLRLCVTVIVMNHNTLRPGIHHGIRPNNIQFITVQRP